MLIKDLNHAIAFADPATNGVVDANGNGWLGTVILHGNGVKSTTPAAAAPDAPPAPGDYPVQICGDFGMLAALCLAPAYAAFAVKDNLAGCRKVWDATEFALSLVAESRGWPCQTQSDHYDLMERLQAKIGNKEEHDISAGYSLACTYRDGAEFGFLEDYVIRHGLPYVRLFLTELLSLAQEPA